MRICWRQASSGLLTLLVALLVEAAPVSADSVIYYSAPESTYGWCAGYDNWRAHGCARQYCIESGGSACEAVEQCPGGWGSVAFPDDPYKGIGAVCGINNRFGARVWALAHCMVAANTLCYTDSTFGADGSRASEGSDAAFDRTWYVQIMLQLRHYQPGTADGDIGPQTRSAIGKFQTDQGLPVTGEPDDATFRRLLDEVGGVGHFVDIVNETVVEGRSEERDWGYAYASQPAPEMSISAELMARAEGERLAALAAMLRGSDRECSVPAKHAELLDDSSGSGVWNISCAEGDYTMIVSADGTRMTMTGGATMVKDTVEPTEEGAQSSPGGDSGGGGQQGGRRPKGQ